MSHWSDTHQLGLRGRGKGFRLTEDAVKQAERVIRQYKAFLNNLDKGKHRRKKKLDLGQTQFKKRLTAYLNRTGQKRASDFEMALLYKYTASQVDTAMKRGTYIGSKAHAQRVSLLKSRYNLTDVSSEMSEALQFLTPSQVAEKFNLVKAEKPREEVPEPVREEREEDNIRKYADVNLAPISWYKLSYDQQRRSNDRSSGDSFIYANFEAFSEGGWQAINLNEIYRNGEDSGSYTVRGFFEDIEGVTGYSVIDTPGGWRLVTKEEAEDTLEVIDYNTYRSKTPSEEEALNALDDMFGVVGR